MKIGFYTGKAWEKWDHNSPNNKGIGGSETALIHLSKELEQFGHEIHLFIDTDKPCRINNTYYHDYLSLSNVDIEFDYFIHYRTIASIDKVKSKCNIGFAQDITLAAPEDKMNLNGKLDYMFSLSEDHTKFLSEKHNFPIEKILMTANGVDPSRYNKNIKKVSNQIFYSSCPSRDLDRLLFYSQDIAKYVKDFKLVVAYGLQTWEGLLRQNRGDHRKYFFTLDMMKLFPWVKFMGRINQNDLADVQMASKAWLYPTTFPETFCITAVEAGYAKCPIISSDVFGLKTTIDDGGIVMKEDPNSAEFKDKFVSNAIRLLTNDNYWQEWSDKAYNQMKKYTWANIAAQWNEFFETNEMKELKDV